MAIVTDGMDQSTIVGYCAKLAAIQTQIEALYAAAEANGHPTTASHFARYSLGNALLALEEARGYLDQARDELPDEEDCDGDDAGG